MKVFSPFLNGNTTTSGSFNVPNHPSTASIQNPLTGSLFHDDTDGILKIYTGTQWQVVGEQTTPAAPPASADIEYLVVAGGGGGGLDGGGGGGAGGYLSSSLSSIESGSSITVTVGGGGAGWTNTSNRSVAAASGTDSSIASATGTSFSTVTSTGGGGGGSGQNIDGRDGGSGGGCSSDGSYSTTGGSGTVGQGFDGGDIGTASNRGGGGGGGASAVGQDSDGANDGGDGGTGKQSNITGTLTYYAGGGGGGARGSGYNAGAGGSGGGAAGGTAIPNNNGNDGTVNTGGGAGGGSGNGPGAGGDGGSGAVILAYPSSSINGAGGITGDAGNGRKYHQFNESGTFKVSSTSDFQIVSNNLVLHLDAGNYASRGASTWSDLTANGYDATLVSSPALGQNFYYDFDGSADYGTFASAAHTALSGQTQGTIEAWVNGDSFTSGTARKTIFGTGRSDQTDRWCVMRVTSTNYLQMSITNDGTNYGCNVTTSLPSTSTWYHFAITYDGSSFAAYYDGVSQTINTTAAGWFNSVASNTLQVGAMDRGSSGNNYDPWNGKIAQVRVYSSALTAAQVLQNYNATKTNFV